MSDGRSIDSQRTPGVMPSGTGQVRAHIETRIIAPRGTGSGPGTGVGAGRATASGGTAAGNGAPVVAVRGELDLATADAFDTIVTAVIARYGADLTVDLSGVSFCDAGGLGALVKAANHAELAGGRLSLAGLSPSLRKLLRAGGLDRRWPDAADPRAPHGDPGAQGIVGVPGVPGAPGSPGDLAGKVLPAAAEQPPRHHRAPGAPIRTLLDPRHLLMHGTLRRVPLLER